MNDYSSRTYLSAIEAAKYLSIPVSELHHLANQNRIKVQKATSGQMRFSLSELKVFLSDVTTQENKNSLNIERINELKLNNTKQTVIIGSSTKMTELEDESVHLMVTSPPYFNAKMYSREFIEDNLGDIHDEDVWFEQISKVWKETYRVLHSGRKMFINIMNLPIRCDGGSYRTLNLVGRTIDVCESLGFIYKRDIIWHKTNGVRAHFGTYPYPGGILINNMHEFILEFDKPAKKNSGGKYKHLTNEQKEESKLDKEFWLKIKNSDVWEMAPQASGDRRSHIAPFPEELPYRLIKAFSYVGETVLDPFLGSGTTCNAAAKLKRNGVGYEINPEIVRDAVLHLKENWK